VSEYVGTYYSVEWIRKNILKQSELEMQQIDAQIQKEKNSGEIDQDAGEDMDAPD
jgi:hypothetical protein